MSKVNVVEYSGTAIQLEAKTGLSVMQILRDNDIAGIIADCGGNLSCATCHVYVEESWLARLPPPDADERAMLECVLSPETNSRLSCQITVSDDLDGIILHIPEKQM